MEATTNRLVKTGGRMANDSLQVMQEAATNVFELLVEARRQDDAGNEAAGQRARDKAGRQLLQTFGRWLDRYFLRMGVPADEAQDMAQDAMLKLVAMQSAVKENAFAVICRARHSIFVDHLKHRKAGKRMVGTAASGEFEAELQLSDESWDFVSDSVAAEATPFDLIDCVRRKLTQYRQQSATRADVLEMHVIGLNAAEIGAVIYKKAEAAVTKREEANVRQRMNDMQSQLQTLFAECKD